MELLGIKLPFGRRGGPVGPNRKRNRAQKSGQPRRDLGGTARDAVTTTLVVCSGWREEASSNLPNLGSNWR
eukprot:2762338-Amphidinium_carterae.1